MRGAYDKPGKNVLIWQFAFGDLKKMKIKVSTLLDKVLKQWNDFGVYFFYFRFLWLFDT